jgi:GH25 family lysozyme M1 (1,4-beta-N-acetylmuramidase)
MHKEERMSYVRGIDVSAWDPYIDWQTVRNQDIRFAIIKSTEGIDYFNKYFNQQWEGSKSAGMLRGTYHYLRAAQDGAKQADFFLSKVDVQDGDLPPFLDIEGANNDGATNSQFIGNAQKWLERVESKTGRRPIVYSTASFLQEKLNGNNGKPPPWAKNYQTWVAQYFNSHSADGGGQPTQPAGWAEWVIWQYSGDKLTLEGIYQDEARTKLVRVDMNVYRHSIEELYKLAKAQQPVNANITAHAPVHTQPTVNPPVHLPPPITPLVETVSPSNLPPASFIAYTVQAGDTLWAISNKHGLTVDAIVQLNNIANPDLIQVGQVLQIPSN